MSDEVVALPRLIDPTLLTETVTVDGVEYTMCFDLGAIGEAEYEMNKQGLDVDLLAHFDASKIRSARYMFAAGIHRFHPEIPFQTAMAMLHPGNVHSIRNSIIGAWVKCLPKTDLVEEAPLAEPDLKGSDTANPSQPGE